MDADGRMLAFAFMTTGTVDANAAQTSLDRLASTLANCGCRDSPSMRLIRHPARKRPGPRRP